MPGFFWQLTECACRVLLFSFSLPIIDLEWKKALISFGVVFPVVTMADSRKLRFLLVPLFTVEECHNFKSEREQ